MTTVISWPSENFRPHHTRRSTISWRPNVFFACARPLLMRCTATTKEESRKPQMTFRTTIADDTAALIIKWPVKARRGHNSRRRRVGRDRRGRDRPNICGHQGGGKSDDDDDPYAARHSSSSLALLGENHLHLLRSSPRAGDPSTVFIHLALSLSGLSGLAVCVPLSLGVVVLVGGLNHDWWGQQE